MLIAYKSDARTGLPGDVTAVCAEKCKGGSRKAQ